MVVDRIVVSGLDSGGENGHEFPLNTRSIQAIIGGELLMQDTSAVVGATGGDSSHDHGVGTIPADTTTVTSTSAQPDVELPPYTLGVSEIPSHDHAYAEPVYSKVNLDIKDTWPSTPDTGDIMLVSPTKIKVFDDLDVEDILIMVVVYEGTLIRP